MRWAGKPFWVAALVGLAVAGCASRPRPVVSDDRYAPVSDSPNMRVVRGETVDEAPLLPEPGDIWGKIVPGDAATGQSSTVTPPETRALASKPPLSLPPSGGVAKTAALVAEGSPGPAAVPPAPAVVAASTGRIQVQLLAAGSEAEARAAWQRLGQRAPEVLQGHAPHIVQADANGHAVWRLRTGGFATRAEATAFCTRLSAAGAQCWVVGHGV